MRRKPRRLEPFPRAGEGVDEILDDRNIYIRLPRAGGRGEKLGVNPIPVEPRLPRAGEGVDEILDDRNIYIRLPRAGGGARFVRLSQP